MFSVLCFVHNAGSNTYAIRTEYGHTSFFSLMLCADPEIMKKQSVVVLCVVSSVCSVSKFFHNSLHKIYHGKDCTCISSYYHWSSIYISICSNKLSNFCKQAGFYFHPPRRCSNYGSLLIHQDSV